MIPECSRLSAPIVDNTLRAHERLAATGDLDARVRYLATLGRTESKLMVGCSGPKHQRTILKDARVVLCCTLCLGTGKRPMPWDERFALAAYCGDEASRVLVPKHWENFDDLSLEAWLPFLQAEWPTAMPRAAIAAAERSLPVWENREYRKCIGCRRSNSSNMCKAHRGPYGSVYASRRWVEEPTASNLAQVTEAFNALPARPGPRDWCLSAAMPSALVARKIQAAAQIAGEPAVRKAIQIELIDWSLRRCKKLEKP